MIEMIDVTNASVNELKTAANRLRTEYTKWKKEHPDQQNEEYINYFLLIKSALEEKNQPLVSRETILDAEAQLLNEVAKIKIVPEVPGEFTFGDLAPVGSSGEEQGETIKLSDLESDFKD